MYKTWKISFALKNTYRVNTILYALKQIPLVKRLLPEALYSARGLKIFANVIAALWEFLSVFLGKFLYFITMAVSYTHLDVYKRQVLLLLMLKYRCDIPVVFNVKYSVCERQRLGSLNIIASLCF